MAKNAARLCWIALIVVALSPAVSCSAGMQADSQATPSRARDIITAQELSNAGSADLLDAVKRLRPRWVRPRGMDATACKPIAVYVGGVDSGELDFLRSIPVDRVVELRFHDADSAIMRWGRHDVTGVIEVTTS